MKKYAWLAAMVCAVFILGAVGNNGMQEVQDLSGSVTYSELMPVEDARDYVSVIMHEPFAPVSLPTEKLAALPDNRGSRLFSGGLSEDASIDLAIAAGMDDDSPEGRDKKKKKRGFLAPRESEDKIGEFTGSSIEKDNGGWGKGWLGEAILSEERIDRNEVDQRKMLGEQEFAERDDRSSASSPGVGSAQGGYNPIRSPGSAPIDTGTGAKSSFKLESWKMQK